MVTFGLWKLDNGRSSRLSSTCTIGSSFSGRIRRSKRCDRISIILLPAMELCAKWLAIGLENRAI